MPADPQRIQSIFLAAIETADPADRAALLARECGDDTELRQRIEVLLRAYDQSGSFLDQPAVQPVTIDAPAGQWIEGDALPLTERPGMRVGRYKLLQQIGEGGMGVVYMAEQQEPIRRMVALKIIKPGMDSEAVVARFEAERQALALMDHQNIARVFDGGTTESGRPFFVMELVKGIPITRFCDENRLTPRERLELFVSVCEAVQHAHQKGVIHRDIKPSNVLVTLYDGKPVPKVIDFGVAKALHQKLTERTMFTAFGTVVGTLEYMSPEQAEMNALDVDTRSDVYSLGVLLYELLTGTTPLERERLRKAAYTEMLRLIREEEPLRPSMRISGSGPALARLSAQRKTEPTHLARLVRGELDWIVMKSLEKDRGRRYETATGLARDVDRYLKDEPVEACPPSVAYRLGKFARKNRVVLSTAAAFVLLLFIAAGVSSWLAVVAHRAEGEANEKRDEADNERDRADREAAQAKANAAEARKSLDRLSVEQGLRLAEEDDLFTALLWFARPLERGGLSPDEERIQRMRFACFLRQTHGRPVLRQMIFHEGMARQLVFSPDAAHLLTETEEGAQVWDLNTGQRVAMLEQSKGVGQLRFMDESRVSGQDGLLTRTWDTTTGRLLHSGVTGTEPISRALMRVLPQSPLQLLRSEEVWDLLNNPGDPSMSPDGRIVAQMEGFGFPLGARFELKNAQDGRSIAVQSNTRWKGPIRFSPDGCNVITAGKDREDKLWDTETGRAAGPLFPNPDLQPMYEFSPDCRMLAIAHGNGIVRVWDLAGYANGVREMRAHSPSQTRAISQVTYSYRNWQGSGYLSTWGLQSLSQLRSSVKVLPPSVVDTNVPAALSPDGRQLATVSSENSDKPGLIRRSTVLLWDANNGRQLGHAMEHPGDLTHVEFSADSRFLVTASNPGPARLWDTHTGKSIGSPLRHGVGIYHAIFSADGNRLVTCGADNAAQLWDTTTANPIGPPLRHADAVNAAVFSPDGRYIATASSDGTARLWDAGTGRPIGRALIHPYMLSEIAFDLQGRLLLTKGMLVRRDSNFGIRIWETATQRPVSPNIGKCGFAYMYIGATFDGEGLFVPDVEGSRYGTKYDLRPDQRPAEDVVRLAQIHAGQRLDDLGNLTPLTKSDLLALWNEMRDKYPSDFTVRPEAIIAWHVERIKTLTSLDPHSDNQVVPAVRLHQKWLAAEMAAVDWRENPALCELRRESDALYRVRAAAQFGRSKQAVATVEDLVAHTSLNTDELYECACICALSARAVKNDAALAERYAARAVALLQQAVAAGYKNGQHLLKESDVDALRHREDFQMLLKKLNAKQP